MASYIIGPLKTYQLYILRAPRFAPLALRYLKFTLAPQFNLLLIRAELGCNEGIPSLDNNYALMCQSDEQSLL